MFNTIEINEILDTFFCEDGLTGKESSLLGLFYPDAEETYCWSLQGVYFVLEYRFSLDNCLNYNKAVLDQLVSVNGCTLIPMPDGFENPTQYFIVTAVQSTNRGCHGRC